MASLDIFLSVFQRSIVVLLHLICGNGHAIQACMTSGQDLSSDDYIPSMDEDNFDYAFIDGDYLPDHISDYEDVMASNTPKGTLCEDDDEFDLTDDSDKSKRGGGVVPGSMNP